MFDHIALPRLTPVQNRIRPNGGNDQEELQNEIRVQRDALLAVDKLMFKRSLMMVTYQQ